MTTRSERLNTAYNALKKKGVVHTQKDVAEKMGASASNVSSALKGVEKVLTYNFIIRFCETFKINPQWLLTGEGEMLKSTEEVAPRDAVPLEDVGRQSNTDNTLDRLLTMMERLIEQGDRQTRVAEINAEANKQNSDNLARLIERWDAMQGNSLSHRPGVG